MSEFFYLPFPFFLREYKVFGFIVVSLISFFSMSQLSNFLKSNFLRQHPSSYCLPICFDPKASSALWASSASLGLQWSLW